MGKEKKLFNFTANIYGIGFFSKLIFIAILASLTSVTQFVLTWYLGIIIDSINEGLDIVLRYFVFIGIAVIIYVLCNTVLGLISGRMTSRFILGLRTTLGEKLCVAEYASLEKIKGGNLLSIVTNDIYGFGPWLAALYSLGHLPIKLLTVLIAMFTINYELALSILLFLPLAMLPSLLLSKKLHPLNIQEKETIANTIGFINEILNFILVVKSFCLETSFQKKNNILLTDVEKAKINRQLREQLIQTFGRCIGCILNPLIFIIGGYFILRGEMTVGKIVTVMLLLNLAGEALNLIYAIPIGYQGAKASMKRLNMILFLPDEKKSDVEVTINVKDKIALAAKHVYFSYDETTVLKDINFSIARGEKIAIVGMSGSGKTTLFKLICGLYTPTSGLLKLQGIDMSGLSTELLRNSFSVVTQELFLFADTIRSNLLFARPDANGAELVAACQNAKIHDFIMSLENGYDTKLADTGTVISKGQMQRLNLARTFLRNAPVWLLDEPTSALDTNTEIAVMDYILNGSNDKTVLTILHNITMPERFDKILVIQNGEAAGFGHHNELKKHNPAYNLLLNKMTQAMEGAI